MSLLADLLSTIFDRSSKATFNTKLDDRPIAELITDLIGNRGEVRGMTLAHQILDRYNAMCKVKKRDFFSYLAADLDINPVDVRAALEAYETDPSKINYRNFMEVAEPARQELIRRLNQVPEATGSLVAMRQDLLEFARTDASLSALDLDFRHLFSSWFNRGFLVLRPINWESPAHVLEKIIEYEAVHTIDSWSALRRRIQPSDRRCFAFFHPTMPDEPLIFVEVALTKGIPGSIQQILAKERDVLEEENADTAVFYSISNCQAGLAGISFGNLLIKQVVDDLSSQLLRLKTFVTLSPIPGFTQWLKVENLEDVATDERLPSLAAAYLIKAKRLDGSPLDPVARFHLGNGALVHAVHADADRSIKGQTQSRGVMVNYLYDLPTNDQNHEHFSGSFVIAASSDITALAQATETIDT
jgi:malonyl-CoA decarboxylase